MIQGYLSMIQALIDASSLIHAWQHYPIKQFESLWRWLKDQIAEQKVATIPEIFEEVKKKEPDCYEWLKEAGIAKIRIDNAVIQSARQIARELGIKDDRYSTQGGAGYNDLLLISVAHITRCSLITNEARQSRKPEKKANSKIPLVCQELSPPVKTFSFIEWLKDKGPVF